MKIRKTAVLVFALFLCLSLCRCGTGPAVMKYGESEIPANWYRFLTSTYKARFLRSYTDMRDTDEFWDSELDEGRSAEEVLNGMVRENVQRTLVCMELFREYKLKLGASQQEKIDAYINDLVKERANGSRNVINQELAQFGVNVGMLRDIYEAQEKAGVVFSYLYGDGGPRKLADEALESYYLTHYARVMHLWINDAYRYETDDKGNYKFTEQGTVATRGLTEEEKASAAEAVSAVRAGLNAGTKFETLWEKYSEDTFYTNGYYLSESSDFIPEVVKAALSMKIGEWVCVESEYGTHFLYRLENDAGAWKNEQNADFFEDYETTVKNADFMEYLDTLLPDVTVDEALIAQYSIRDAVVNYSY